MRKRDDGPRKQVSASKTDLFLHCQYPWTPGLELPYDESGEEAIYGTAFHWLIAWLLAGGKLKSPRWEKKVAFAARKWKIASPHELEGHVRSSFQILRKWLRGGNEWGADFWTVGEREVETSYALNPKTGATRPCEAPREEDHVYPDLKKNEIGMTVDLRIIADDVTLALDHKTGMEGHDFREPEENAQMLTIGAAVGANPGGSRNTILAIYHADRKSLPEIHAQEVEADQLVAHTRSLRKAQRRVGEGSLTPGPWCKFCPAKPICPAAAGSIVVAAGQLLSEVLEDVQGPGGVGPAGITALVKKSLDRGITKSSDVGRYHAFQAEMRRLMTAGDREIRAWLREHPKAIARTPEGKRLVFRKYVTERYSKERAIKNMGAEAADKLFARLRRLGVLESKEEERLIAAWED